MQERPSPEVQRLYDETLINEMMQPFYSHQDTLAMGLAAAIAQVRKMELELRRIVEDYQVRDDDCRGGNETYGYSGDVAILTNLHYISDRWKCAFRITWMLGLLDRNYR